MAPGPDLVVEPARCAGLAILVAACHGAAAVVPWAAGCSPAVAGGLSLLCLGVLPAALRAVPGQAGSIRRLRGRDGAWFATLDDGLERPAELSAASRVTARFVFCQVRVAGQKLDWWIPAYAVPAGGFRHLKVALRCGPRQATC